MKAVNILTLCLAMGISMCDDASASDGPLGVIGDEGFQLLERLFEYDDDVPLDALVLESRDLTHGKRHKILYSGLWRSRVPAYLEIPHDVGPPYPCVVLFHKLTDSKEQWWPMIDSLEGRHRDRLVSEGMAVFAMDMPLHGDRLAENEFENPRNLIEKELRQRYRELFIQAIQENRRGLDYLMARGDIDSTRVGVLGYGLGASMALCMAAVDPRVKAGVAAAPPTEPDPLSVRAIQNYAGRLRDQPFLLQTGTFDPWTTPEATKQLYELLDTPTKKLKEYHSDHRLPIWYINDSVDWLVTYVK